MSCKLKARLASLNNFTRLGGEAGGDYCSRSVRIFKLQQNRIARIKEWRIKWEVCELIRNVNISDDKWTGRHVLLEQPPAHSNFTQRTEGVYALCLIYRVQPSLGKQNCHAFVYLLYGTRTLENFPLYQLQFNLHAFLFKNVLKPWTTVGARQGGFKELSTKNLFQAEILKIFQFYFSQNTNLLCSSAAPSIPVSLQQHLKHTGYLGAGEAEVQMSTFVVVHAANQKWDPRWDNSQPEAWGKKIVQWSAWTCGQSEACSTQDSGLCSLQVSVRNRQVILLLKINCFTGILVMTIPQDKNLCKIRM